MPALIFYAGMRQNCPMGKGGYAVRQGKVFEPNMQPVFAPEQPEQAKLEFLPGGTGVYVDKNHRFGADALALAGFCRLHRSERACDLGSGCGIIPLCWHDVGHVGKAVGLELSTAGNALLERAAAGLGHIYAVQGDMRLLGRPDCPEKLRQALPGAEFDLVSCNPPYFTGGFVSQKPGRAPARHAITCSLEDVCRAAAFLLREGGRFCLCNRPERLADTIVVAGRERLVAKRLQLVRSSPTGEVRLFLLDCRKGGKSGLEFLADLILPPGEPVPLMPR